MTHPLPKDWTQNFPSPSAFIPEVIWDALRSKKQALFVAFIQPFSYKQLT